MKNMSQKDLHGRKKKKPLKHKADKLMYGPKEKHLFNNSWTRAIHCSELVEHILNGNVHSVGGGVVLNDVDQMLEHIYIAHKEDTSLKVMFIARLEPGSLQKKNENLMTQISYGDEVPFSLFTNKHRHVSIWAPRRLSLVIFMLTL